MRRILLPLIIISILLTTKSYAQQGEWTWMSGDNTPNQPGTYGTQGVFASTNKPPAMYEACQWTDLQGNFWLFGGSGTGIFSDLWEFDPVANQWAWINGPGTPDHAGIYGTQNVSSPANYPGARAFGALTWVDYQNNLWLFGGWGYDAAGNPGLLSDLWEYDIVANEWTWRKGQNTINNSGLYGSIGIENIANNPGGRYESATTWLDNNNNLWFFGGKGLDAAATQGYLGDLWKYNIINNAWTWVNGSNIIGQTPNYGTIHISNPSNHPGARSCFSAWKSINDDLWLFGGYNNNAGGDLRNDMWRYRISTNEWTWESGTNLSNDFTSVVGSQCTPATNNIPAARYQNRSCFTRQCNNFEFFGGLRDATGNNTYADLWNFNVNNDEWTWMNGSTSPNQVANYGTMMVSSPANKPSGRGGAVGFQDKFGYLWVFGGMNNSGANNYNDLWKFVPDTTCPATIFTGAITSSFTANPLSGCTPLTVQFNNTSNNAISFVWNFGDTSSSALPNPVHTYQYGGVYTVTLVAISTMPCGNGADTATYTNYITVSDPALAAFTADTLNGCNPFTVNFANGSSNGISYLWDFGDTQTDTASNPTHIYTSAGIFNVSLIVYGGSGCNDTLMIPNYINVINHPVPSSAFTGDTLLACNSLNVQFANTSTFGTAYKWYFGDGDSSSLMSPSHFYTGVGTYTVTLITYNTGFCGTYTDTLVRTNYVVVSPMASASFIATTLVGCTPLSVSFVNNSANSTSYLWNFGDGGTSTSTTPTHIYTAAGTYTVTLIGYSGTYCNDTSIRTNYIFVENANVTSSFTADTIHGCDSLTVHFTNTSMNSTSCLWTFGDGTYSASTDVIHTYHNPGIYNVYLITHYFGTFCTGGPDTSYLPSPIVVEAIDTVKSAFIADITRGCSPFTVHFLNNSDYATDYIWNFGDGLTDSVYTNPIHTYMKAGLYTVKLWAGNSSSACIVSPDSLTRTEFIRVDSCFHTFFHPSQTRGHYTLDYNLASTGVFTVYDLLGQELFNYNLPSLSGYQDFPTEYLRASVYYYKLVSDNQIVVAGKFAVIK